MISRDDRLVGGVWGHLVGDALGVPYEFRSPGAVGQVRWGEVGTHSQPAGTWSDDGGLMLALLDSLLERGFDLDDQGRRGLAWRYGSQYKPGELFDVGNTTSRALGRIRAGVKAAEAGGITQSDNGNGSLMRILPVALVGGPLGDRELIDRAMRASAVTHGHPCSKVVCALYVLVAARLLDGVEPTAALDAAKAALESALDDPGREELARVCGHRDRTGSGYVVDTFWSAWDAFAGADDYQQCVTRAIEYGNDTDTTAAVAGGLAGLHWGIHGIPAKWVEVMRGQEIVNALLAKLLAQEGQSTGSRPVGI